MSLESELLPCAMEAAMAAGQHARRNWRRRTEAISLSPHDVKLKLDIECQERATATIRRRFPKHAVLGEETPSAGPSGHASRWLWIIDPIDGTVNFSHGLPLWCCSVAVRRAGATIAGAVYAPLLGELYAAGPDSPATLNGVRIKVSDVSSVERALVLTGLDKKAQPGKKALRFLRAHFTNCPENPRAGLRSAGHLPGRMRKGRWLFRDWHLSMGHSRSRSHCPFGRRPRRNAPDLRGAPPELRSVKRTHPFGTQTPCGWRVTPDEFGIRLKAKRLRYLRLLPRLPARHPTHNL